MSDPRLEAILQVIQEDVGKRGLRTDPHDNLVTACPNDFREACRNLAETRNPVVGILTGFLIPHAVPPCGETDGPLGAVFLVEALSKLGASFVLLTDGFCCPALSAGLHARSLFPHVHSIVALPKPGSTSPTNWAHDLLKQHPVTHLIALERVGPSHTRESLAAQKRATIELEDSFLREVPVEHRDRYHTMKGRDITNHMAAAHLLVEAAARLGTTTIGIGDGGNEIGMGKIPWETIRRNVPNGGLVACRVPTDYLIVAGVSNWGGYALSAGVSLLMTGKIDDPLFDPARERQVLQVMVEQGPLVDGVTGTPTATVDGLNFEHYSNVLVKIREICR